MPRSVPTAMSTGNFPTPPQSPAEPHLLDNAVWAALTGPHAHFAERVGRAVRYPLDVCPFSALADPADPGDWDDLAELAGPGHRHRRHGSAGRPRRMGDRGARAGRPTGRHRATRRTRTRSSAARTRRRPRDPGPGRPGRAGALPAPHRRTRRLSRHPAPRTAHRHGRGTCASAGLDGDQRRLHPPGTPWAGSGHAAGPGGGGRDQGTRGGPLPHALASNTTAIRLYESIGFTLRRRTDFVLVRSPGRHPAPTP